NGNQNAGHERRFSGWPYGMQLAGQIVVASLGVPSGRTKVAPQQSALKAASRKASQKIVARDQRSDDRFV
ncbi:hypothetical protein PIG50_29555, partial [Escherichia coli]|nr:hypothetical protein [Escherichia coli]